MKDVYCGVWFLVKPHNEIKEEYNTKDSKTVKKDYGFELLLSFSKEIEPIKAYEAAKQEHIPRFR